MQKKKGENNFLILLVAGAIVLALFSSKGNSNYDDYSGKAIDAMQTAITTRIPPGSQPVTAQQVTYQGILNMLNNCDGHQMTNPSPGIPVSGNSICGPTKTCIATFWVDMYTSVPVIKYDNRYSSPCGAEECAGNKFGFGRCDTQLYYTQVNPYVDGQAIGAICCSPPNIV